MNKTINFSSIISKPIIALNDETKDMNTTVDRNQFKFNAQKVTQNRSNVTQSEPLVMENNKELIINNIISILSESKAKLWFDSGISQEYEKRFRRRLPPDWIQTVRESDEKIDVEVHNYSNVTKTLIALPITVNKKRSSVASTTSLNEEKANDDKPNAPLVESSSESQTPSLVSPVNAAQNDKKISEIMSSALNYCEANSGEDVIFGGKQIPSPVLPAVKPNPQNSDDFFDVIVLLAATPNNFIVIPFNNISIDSQFNQMKQRMHDLYEKEENRIDLPENVITKGLYFAGKFRNIWYRIQVKEIINRSPFQVMCSLVDYGEIQTFDLKDIQPLYNEFRGLPVQAIRASLASAEPIGTDWDVMASVEFRKMVENKPFVATVYDIKHVDNEPVLSISLCDTSGANDNYIGKSLVEKGLAKLRIPVI